MGNRLDKDREAQLQPKRMDFIKTELAKRSIEVVDESVTWVRFMHKGSVITFYPYSGWATGATITDGRGAQNLLNQLDQ